MIIDGKSSYQGESARRLRMIFIIGSILLIILILIIGLILRKRTYDEVDRQENWKVNIMNRNVAGQLARIKELNLSGETQEKFETWKEKWETIVTKDLADVEEALFEAEDLADRYRFPTARKVIQRTDAILEAVEKDIDQILLELDQLIDIEKQNREEIEQIEPRIKKLQKHMLQNRYQYGKADILYEKKLEQLEEKIASYYELVHEGNYLQAKTLVDEVKNELTIVDQAIQDFPALYKMCKDTLPHEFNALLTGIQEMEEAGYPIKHFDLKNEIEKHQKSLEDSLETLGKGQLTPVKEMISEAEERIKEIYDLLEKEALAKNYVDSHMPTYRTTLKETVATFQETKLEVEHLKQSYYLTDQDMEQYMTIEKAIEQLEFQLDKMNTTLENKEHTYTDLRKSLEKDLDELKQIKQNHNDFKEKLNSLRHDEIEAKEKLSHMRQDIQNTYRKIEKSNIPGVPKHITNILEEAWEKNDAVYKALEEQPLDMAHVQNILTEAQTLVNHLKEQTAFMLNQAYLTEQVIQYANRYRSRSPLLATELNEAEQLFRKYNYELALEKAAKAIEEVEPGALKKIENMQTIG